MKHTAPAKTDYAAQQAAIDQLRAQGWTVRYRRNTDGYCPASAELWFNGTRVVLDSADIFKLVPVASSIWVGLHE